MKQNEKAQTPNEFGEFNLFSLERKLIAKALTKYGEQGLEVVSEKLGISRRTLFRKRREYGIE